MADAECEKVADPELESGSSERDAILKRQRQELKDLRGMSQVMLQWTQCYLCSIYSLQGKFKP